MSAYKTAIDLTTQAIDNRARYFRNQIVSVVLVGAVSIAVAAYAWTLWPLIFLLLVIPLCGAFLLLDGRLLGNWRSQLLASWAKRELDLWPFRDAMAAIPTLPKATLQGMLAMLPWAPDWSAEQTAATNTRERVVVVAATIHACRNDEIALKTLGAMVVTSAMICAVAIKTWLPLLLIMATFLLPLLTRQIRRGRLRKLRTSIVTAKGDADFNAIAFGCLLDSLDWRPIAVSEKQNLTAAILA
jgi:uncharacterized protein (DUF983 family)